MHYTGGHSWHLILIDGSPTYTQQLSCIIIGCDVPLSKSYYTSEKISAGNCRQVDQFTPVVVVCPRLRDFSVQSKNYTNFLARWRAPPPCQKCPCLALAKGYCKNDNYKKILMACDACPSMKYDCDRTIFLSCRTSLFATVTCGLKWCSIIAVHYYYVQLA